ncbi:MAG: cryptochrome/photolyase family protein [Hyphomicrobiaceae bacterium]
MKRPLQRNKLNHVRVTEPGEWRLLHEVGRWSKKLRCPVEVLADTRFLTTRAEFAQWAAGRKQLRMEFFYREMRRRTGLLMEDGRPAGGHWNFDADNRKPATGELIIPQVRSFRPDATTRDVLKTVEKHFSDHFGELEPFWFAVRQVDAETALDHFINECLPMFGDYQDAMISGQRFLYHSVLSAYINAGLLEPLTVCQRAARAYALGLAPLNAVEGFIRQIIGWREYVRGIYWINMPEYAASNYLGATRQLPKFYWTGEVDMHCLAEAIKQANKQTKEEAYAHHIQRPMVTGSFAMLVGIAPREIHEWYLAVYADAYDWVELPNVIGMSQFADGGMLASKPYAASGNYIRKMSYYCQSYRFDVKQKTGRNACPFNALYWDFLARNINKIGDNPRLRNAYATWRRMSDANQLNYRNTAATFLEQLD